MKKTICLNMIVKNESKNLHRLFKSLHEVMTIILYMILVQLMELQN